MINIGTLGHSNNFRSFQQSLFYFQSSLSRKNWLHLFSKEIHVNQLYSAVESF